MAVLKIGNIEIENAVLLAPMEDVTDMHFRRICRRMGADIVYSEFIASEGIVRNVPTLMKKMNFHEEERPVAIQIYGANIDSMVESAKIVEDSGADFIDINFGCWVKNVVKHNAGAALLKEPDKMVAMTKAVVDAVKLPVTVKTRLGWDRDSIIIAQLAERLEDTGIQALTVHCRTRKDGYGGQADWSWIPKIKENVSIPVILNGDVTNHLDAKRAFDETGCDAVMIGRAAIGNPFVFREVKQYLQTGEEPAPVNYKERIDICLEHLRMEIEYKGARKAIPEFRKHYTGYLKGLHNSHPIRQKLVLIDDYDDIESLLLKYAVYLTERQ